MSQVITLGMLSPNLISLGYTGAERVVVEGVITLSLGTKVPHIVLLSSSSN